MYNYKPHSSKPISSSSSSSSQLLLLLLTILSVISLFSLETHAASVSPTVTSTAIAAPVCDSTTLSQFCNYRGTCSSTSANCVCNSPFYGPKCEHGCSGRVLIAPSSDISVTTGFLSDGPLDYFAATTCQWDLVAPANKVISLRVTYVALEVNWDYLYIFNGPSARSNTIAALTGDISEPMDYVLDSTTGLVLFYSDISLTYGGFNISYWISSCPFNCSSRGICSNGVCSCPSNYSGDYCQTPVCKNSCSGNGICSFGICTCFAGFGGPDCSTNILNGGFTLQSSASTTLSVSKDIGRMGHTAVLVSTSGIMYVFGGYKRDFTITNSFIRLRLSDMNWDTVATFPSAVPVARYSHSAVVYSNSMYIYGGIGNNGFLSDIWKFDITIATWVEMSTISLSQSFGHTATVVSKTMVVLGGYNGASSSYIQVVQEVDLDTNQIRSFKPTGVAPVRLFGHTAVYDGSDGILVYGGYSPLNARAATSSKLLYIYWVNDKTWSSLRAGPEARAFHTAYMIPNTPLMAVIGGNLLNGLSSYTSSVLLYDTSCNTWTTSTPGGIALQSRYSHTSVVLNNGILFIFGGFRGSVLSDLSVLTTPVCANITTKNACINSISCGWCSSTSKCVAATTSCPVTFTRPETNSYCTTDPCRQLHSCGNCMGASTSSSKCNWCSNFAYCFSTVASANSPSTPPGCNAISTQQQCNSVPPTTSVSCTSRYDCGDCSSDDLCTWVSSNLDFTFGTKCASKGVSGGGVCPASCFQRTSCSDCLNIDGGMCMWCSSSRKCLPLKEYNGVQPYGQCQSWVVGSSASCPADCEAQRECGDCLTIGGCGWCSSNLATGLGVCIRGTIQGDANGTCSSGNWKYTTCPACSCNGHSACNEVGTCLSCSDNTMGTRCEKCAPGYFGDARNGGSCSLCAVQRGNSTCYSCDSLTGACTNCSANRQGSNCQDCASGYYENFFTKICTKCNCNGHSASCDTITGACQKCDFGYEGAECGSCKSGFIGNALNGGTCRYLMDSNTKYQFNVEFKKLNLVYYPIEDGIDTSFSIKIGGTTVAEAYLDLWALSPGSPESSAIYIMRNQRLQSFTMSISESVYDMSNLVFYMTITTNTPFNFEIWWSQYPAPLNLLHFFLTFFACFFSLLMLSFIVWRIKMHYDRQRYIRELTVVLQHMATRPSASVTLWDFCAADGSRAVQTKTVPVAVEPMKDGKAAVMTFMIELPTSPAAPRQVCFGSTIVKTPNGNVIDNCKWDDDSAASEDPEESKSKSKRFASRVKRRLRRNRQSEPDGGSHFSHNNNNNNNNNDNDNSLTHVTSTTAML